MAIPRKHKHRGGKKRTSKGRPIPTFAKQTPQRDPIWTEEDWARQRQRILTDVREALKLYRALQKTFDEYLPKPSTPVHNQPVEWQEARERIHKDAKLANESAKELERELNLEQPNK